MVVVVVGGRDWTGVERGVRELKGKPHQDNERTENKIETQKRKKRGRHREKKKEGDSERMAKRGQ